MSVMENQARKKLQNSLAFFYEQFCVRYVPWLKTPELTARFMERVPCFDADILQCRISNDNECKQLGKDLLENAMVKCREYGRAICVKFSHTQLNIKIDASMDFVYGTREEITNYNVDSNMSLNYNVVLNPFERSAYLHDLELDANKDDVCVAVVMILSVTKNNGEPMEKIVIHVPEWDISGAFGWSQQLSCGLEINMNWLIAKSTLHQHLSKPKFCQKYLRELAASMVRMDGFYWYFYHQSILTATEIHINNPSMRYLVMEILTILPYFLPLNDFRDFAEELQEVFIQLNNKPYPACSQLSKSVLPCPEEYVEWPEMRLQNLVGMFPHINSVDQFRCSRSLLDHLSKLLKKRAPHVIAFLQMFSQTFKDELKPKKIISIFRKLCTFIRTIMSSSDPQDFMGGCINRDGAPRKVDYEELIKATLTLATECFYELVHHKDDSSSKDSKKNTGDGNADSKDEDLFIDPKYKNVCVLMKIAFKELRSETEIEFLNAIIHNLYKRNVLQKKQLSVFRKKNKQRLLELTGKTVIAPAPEQ